MEFLLDLASLVNSTLRISTPFTRIPVEPGFVAVLDPCCFGAEIFLSNFCGFNVLEKNS